MDDRALRGVTVRVMVVVVVVVVEKASAAYCSIVYVSHGTDQRCGKRQYQQ
jgi:hypothetical protein